MKEYFLTIVKHKRLDYVSEFEIRSVLDELQKRLNINLVEVVYEIDNVYGNLHGHVLIQSPKCVTYKKHSSIKGFRVYWVPVYNGNSLLGYLHKDSINRFEQEQILTTNYYRHNYGFI